MKKNIFFLLLLALGFAALGPGCAPRQIPPALPETKTEPQGLAGQADYAWQRGDFAKSEQLYLKLLERGGLSADQELRSWKRLTLSALENEHTVQADAALAKWASLDPGAKDAWEWHLAKFRIMAQRRDQSGGEAHLTLLVLNSDHPWMLRQQAATFLTDRFWQGGHFGPAFQIQHLIYAQAESNATRSLFEEEMLLRLEEMPDETLPEAVASVPQERSLDYPYALVLWENATRTLSSGRRSWSQVWQTLNRIAHHSHLTMRRDLLAELQALNEIHGLPSQGVALLLPLSGRFAPIGWKILSGAGAAQWRLVRSGLILDVVAINSDAADWREQLAQLPATYSVVGGPLQRSTWQDVMTEGFHQRRAFFAFRSSLDDDQEGVTAWRFFGSPEDQASTLVETSSQELQALEVAILYPRDRFGLRMAEIFWREAAARGIAVTGMESYPPDEPTRWGEAVSRLLRVPEEDAGEERPDPDFQAVFIPDSLSKAQLILPNFHYFDEDRLFFFGPELWSQGLTQGQEIESRYFTLAITPGAWWPDNPSSGTRALRDELETMGNAPPDFWSALGFDFINFASAMGTLPWNWDAGLLNSILSGPLSMDWSMAPIVWDGEGRARQRLFLFQPRSKGIVPLDPERLREKADQIYIRHEARRQARLAEENATAESPQPETRISTEELSQ